MEIHTERLEGFLSSAGSQSLDEPDRGRLQSMLDGLGKGWNSGITREQARQHTGHTASILTTYYWQVVEGAGILAGLGWGFYQGYRGEVVSTGSFHVDEFIWDNAPTSARVAAVAGWVGGLGARWYYSREKEDKSDDDD